LDKAPFETLFFAYGLFIGAKPKVLSLLSCEHSLGCDKYQRVHFSMPSSLDRFQPLLVASFQSAEKNHCYHLPVQVKSAPLPVRAIFLTYISPILENASWRLNAPYLLSNPMP
jgi:hypothetical protein